MDISERLRSIRKAKNMSVYKLSQLSGVSETHIRDSNGCTAVRAF